MSTQGLILIVILILACITIIYVFARLDDHAPNGALVGGLAAVTGIVIAILMARRKNK